MSRAIELYLEVSKHGVKPILGWEMHVSDDTRAHLNGNARRKLLAADHICAATDARASRRHSARRGE